MRKSHEDSRRGDSPGHRKFTCSICNVDFKRAEHLSRHKQSHLNRKPFVCNSCGKGFSRRDTLNRHVPIHDLASRNGQSSRRGLVSRVAAACTNCARLRLRCDGEPTCARCKSKGIECSYKSTSRRRIPVVGNVDPQEGKTVDDSASTDASQPGQIQQNDQQQRRNNQPSPSNLPSPPSQPEHFSDLESHSVVQAHSRGDEQSALNTLSQVAIGLDLSSHHVQSPLHAAQSVAPTSVPSPALHAPQTPQVSFAAHDSTVPVSGDHNANSLWPPDCHMPTYLSSAEDDWPQVLPTSDNPLDNRIRPAIDHAPAWNCDFNIVDCITFDPFMEDSTAGFRDSLWPQISPPVAGTTRVLDNPSSMFDDHHHIPQTPARTPSYSASDQPSQNSHVTKGLSSSDNSQMLSPVRPPNRAPRTTPVHQWPTEWEPRKSDNLISFPDMSLFSVDLLEAENFAHVERLGYSTYNEISQCLQRMNGDHFRRFHTCVLPPIQVMDCFVQLYFEHFHPIFPMLHQPTFNPSTTPWQLVLAIAAVGCRYSKAPGSEQCSNALQELLRRVIAGTGEADNSSVREIWYAQLMLLNSIGMMYSGNKRLFEIAEAFRNGHATLCRRNGSLRPSNMTTASNTMSMSLEDVWRRWVLKETLRRLGCCSFLIDAQAALYFDLAPCMLVTELQQQLPCCERLWDAATPQEWRKLYTELSDTDNLPSIKKALTDLRLGYSPPVTVGDFARLVLVFATYHTTAGALKHYRNGVFSGYPDPNGSQQNWGATTIKGLELLTPNSRSPSTSSLRYSLDCHILLSSTLLITPREELLTHAHCFRTNEAQMEVRQSLEEWLHHSHGSTARQAVAYAARLLGLLRSSPCHGFFEPVSAMLSILTIWTYSQLAWKPELHTAPGMPDDGSTKRCGHTIRLDRLRGESDTIAWRDSGDVRGHLTDVGNIRRPGAPERVLQVGLQLLKSMNTWNLSQGLSVWLGKLKERSENSVVAQK